jgi:hypothetical protein
VVSHFEYNTPSPLPVETGGTISAYDGEDIFLIYKL